MTNIIKIVRQLSDSLSEFQSIKKLKERHREKKCQLFYRCKALRSVIRFGIEWVSAINIFCVICLKFLVIIYYENKYSQNKRTNIELYLISYWSTYFCVFPDDYQNCYHKFIRISEQFVWIVVFIGLVFIHYLSENKYYTFCYYL